MTINPRILLIIAAIGVAIFFTQKNNTSDQNNKASEDAERKSQAENTIPKPKSSRELLSDSITAINFPDKELERCVFDETKEGSDSANKKDVAALTKLQCNAMLIRSHH